MGCYSPAFLAALERAAERVRESVATGEPAMLARLQANGISAGKATWAAGRSQDAAHTMKQMLAALDDDCADTATATSRAKFALHTQAEIQAAILEYLGRRPYARTSEIRADLRVSEKSSAKALAFLVAQGAVHHKRVAGASGRAEREAVYALIDREIPHEAVPGYLDAKQRVVIVSTIDTNADVPMSANAVGKETGIPNWMVNRIRKRDYALRLVHTTAQGAELVAA